MSDGAVLSGLLTQERLLVAPGVHDGLSAAVAARAGVKAACISGAAVSAAEGPPDIGPTTVTEIARAIAVARRHLAVPVIADAGFGDETDTFRTVRTYEDAGAAARPARGPGVRHAVRPPRRQLPDPGRRVVLKIRAALAARRRETLIAARTDAIAVEGFGAAIDRAKAYVAAGADVLVVEAPQTLDQVAAVPSAIDAPVIVNVVPGGTSPEASREQLERFGYAGAILPGATVSAAFTAVTKALSGTAGGALAAGSVAGPRALFEAVDLDEWSRRRRRRSRDRLSYAQLDAASNQVGRPAQRAAEATRDRLPPRRFRRCRVLRVRGERRPADLPVGEWATAAVEQADGCRSLFRVPAAAPPPWAEESAGFATTDVDDDATAVILYTSGATGRPKRATLRHGTMRDNALAGRDLVDADAARPDTT